MLIVNDDRYDLITERQRQRERVQKKTNKNRQTLMKLYPSLNGKRIKSFFNKL